MKLPVTRNLLFGTAALVFIANQFFQQKLQHTFYRNYLDDILCLPICYGIILRLFQLLFTKHYTLPLAMQVLGFLMICFSEWLFPQISPRFHFDPLDFAAYAFGAVLFALLDNRANRLGS